VQDLCLTVTYFAEPGPQNTAATLRAALARASDLGISDVLVASDTGKTAREALRVFQPGFRVTVVTNPAGLRLPLGALHDYLPAFRAHRDALEAKGVGSVEASLSEEVVDELRRSGAVVHRVDWRRLADFVRALNPWPTAWSFLDRRGERERTIFLRVRPGPPGRPGSGVPGEVAEVKKDGFSVWCGGGTVEVLEIQRQGGERLDAAAYLRGRALKAGDRFLS